MLKALASHSSPAARAVNVTPYWRGIRSIAHWR